jgi:class 3 adenylate cyclase
LNLANRLEELAEKNQIIVSEETKNIIENKFILKEISVNPDQNKRI